MDISISKIVGFELRKLQLQIKEKRIHPWTVTMCCHSLFSRIIYYFFRKCGQKSGYSQFWVVRHATGVLLKSVLTMEQERATLQLEQKWLLVFILKTVWYCSLSTDHLISNVVFFFWIRSAFNLGSTLEVYDPEKM